MSEKTCEICGKKTRYHESDDSYEYWYSICEHVDDYRIDRNTGDVIKYEK